MKKYFSITMLICFLAFFMSGCSGLDEQGKQCLGDIKKGLQGRFENVNLESSSYEEYQDNVIKGVDTELSAIIKYKDVKFDNEKFDDIIKKYIEALESQKEGISFIFSDTEKYQNLYIEKGLVVRSDCISKLKNNYGLTVDKDYEENLDKVIKGTYIPLVAPGEQVKVNTEYGEIGVKFIGFDTLVNPADDKELVMYCELENISYYDEWNGESIIFDTFMSVFDGAGYNIEIKSECYHYIDGYKECAGFADLKQGEKGKFAIIMDYNEDIDILYVSFGGKDKAYGCYLTSEQWKANFNKNSVSNVDNTVDKDNIDYNLIREQMSNYSCEGMYNIYDGWVYSMNFPEDGGESLFSKMRTNGDDYAVLIEKGSPYFIHIDGEYIYTIIANGKSTNIYRCRLGGNDLTQIVKDNAWNLQVTDDYLYYNKCEPSTRTNLGFYRANKDGSNETLIMDKEIYYSYIIGNTLYYQDDSDNETVHKYDINKKIDKRVTNNISYGFVVDGKNGYYIKNDKSASEGDWVGTLVRIDLKTKEEKILYDGVSTGGIAVSQNEIYFINANDEERIYSVGKDGKGVKLISQDTNCSNLAIFGDKIMYVDFTDDKKYVEGIYLCEDDGSNKIQISK